MSQLSAEYIPHGECRFFLGGGGDMGVGVQGEASGEMAEDAGYGLDVHAVLQAVFEGLALIGGAEAEGEVKDGVVIIQRQPLQEGIRLLEAFLNFRRGAVIGLLVDFKQLIQNRFTIAVAGIKGVCTDVCVWLSGNIVQ